MKIYATYRGSIESRLSKKLKKGDKYYFEIEGNLLTIFEGVQTLRKLYKTAEEFIKDWENIQIKE